MHCFVFLCIALNEELANTNVMIDFMDHEANLRFESLISNVTVYSTSSSCNTFPCDVRVNITAGEEYIVPLRVFVGKNNMFVDITVRFQEPLAEITATSTILQTIASEY